MFTHSGKKRELIFDIKKFQKFKDKINYLVVESLPKGIEPINSYDADDIKESKIILNAYRREHHQRNSILNLLKSAEPNDQVIISDVDEIPNLENINFNEIKNKIILFNQKMFYYKFNLILENMNWHGSKSCKMKNLISPQWLRDVKDRKYPLWRIDALFSEKKYNDVFFVQDGGWHFTNIKTPEEIDKKLRSYLHHIEYDQSNIGAKEIDKMIKEKKPVYDLLANSSEAKFRSQKKLKTVDMNELPIYLQKNKEKFNEWILKN
jgi:beta-1,4-mannosyl-glycoprotein beta-1,4-N-acetylglucosaminyltransferase